VRDDRERLADILEAIERIEKHTAGGKAVFDADELVQNWVLRHLEIIGEAVRALSPATRKSSPDLPWTAIIGMRTILVHRYFEIDTAIVWSVVTRDLPTLKAGVAALLDRGELEH